MYETSSETGEDRLIGPVEIQMVYDSEHNGARIVANKQASSGDKEDEEVANHLIAMQTEMDVVQEKVILSTYTTFWGVNPPVVSDPLIEPFWQTYDWKRQYRAVF